VGLFPRLDSTETGKETVRSVNNYHVYHHGAHDGTPSHEREERAPEWTRFRECRLRARRLGTSCGLCAIVRR
jgi:hypothetical protein